MKFVFSIIVMALTAYFLVGCKTMSAPEQQETAELHMQIAISYIQKDNLPTALKELLIAEDLAPSNAAVQSNLGLVYFLRDRYELSERHYMNAVKFKPDFTEAKNNLARVYIEYDQLRKAEPLLQESLKDLTFTDFSSVYANYGILEFKRKRYPTAKVYLKKSLETDRENCMSHVYLGRANLELNELSLASDEFEKGVAFCSPLGIDEAHYYAALAFFRNNQKDRAMVRFEELIKLFPNGKNNEKAKKMLSLIKKGNL